jgi:hypothetical protein
MKTIAVPCDVDGKKVPIQFHVGDPNPQAHPIAHQAAWLGRERGVYVPQEVMESMEDIHTKSKEMGVPFEELVAFALERAIQERDKKDAQQ